MGDSEVRDVPRAMAAATSVASGLGLPVDEAIVVQASNRLAVRLLPSDVLARVADTSHGAAQLEVDLATRLAVAGSPIGVLDPRVAPRVHEHDGFAITLWTYYPTGPSREIAPAAYADALVRLHGDLRRIDLATPHCMDRVREAAGLVQSPPSTSKLSNADRYLLSNTFTDATRAILERQPAEQPLHGEPHPGNVLNTDAGPLLIDLETCCRGPVEFDLAHVPEAVSAHYPGIDLELLQHCRVLVLAMVAAWRLHPADQFPGGELVLREIVAALRSGPPYPALGAITGLN
jgi:Ser/Thr protein kinase RdoA (MazF antagonist)